MNTKRTPLAVRFWAKVRRGPGCWEWTGATSSGYGVICRGGKGGANGAPMLYAHRVSWELRKGPVPSGMRILHRCDNPQCVRLSHLILGTAKDNSQDMSRKGRCRRGSTHWTAKLSEDDARDIIAARRSGISGAVLAEKYGVRRNTIYRIANGERWSWL